MSEQVKISVKINDLKVTYEGDKETANKVMDPFIKRAARLAGIKDQTPPQGQY